MARTRQLQDFIGFQFNGRHSSEFGLKVVSNSNRFQDNFGPTFKDNTVKVPGGDGNFYWNTEDDKKEWNLSVAFDDVTEMELRQMRQWLNSKAMGELIFDEEPYKAYKVKMKSPAQFKYLCFDKEIEGDEPYTSTLIHNHTLEPSQESEAPAQSVRNVKRVYKGEGTIAFVAYQPYAEVVYKYLDQYSDWTNVSEWSGAAGLLNTQPTAVIVSTTLNAGVLSVDKIYYGVEIDQFSGKSFSTPETLVNLNPQDFIYVTSSSSKVEGKYVFGQNGSLLGYQREGPPDYTTHYWTVAFRDTMFQKYLQNLPSFLYNPGDLSSDWTLRFATTDSSNSISLTLWEQTLSTSTSLGTVTLENLDPSLTYELSSKTQLCRCFDLPKKLYNKSITKDGFFKIPTTTNFDTSVGPVYRVEINHTGMTDVKFDYTYLYY